MTTESIHIPEKLYERLKEAAEREQISLEDLVRDALEQRMNANSLRNLFVIGERNARRSGAIPEDVAAEITAYRSERNT